MKIPVVSKESGEFFFDLDIPFMEWRAWKKAAHEAEMTMDDWLEMVVRKAIKFENSVRRRQRFIKLRAEK